MVRAAQQHRANNCKQPFEPDETFLSSPSDSAGFITPTTTSLSLAHLLSVVCTSFEISGRDDIVGDDGEARRPQQCRELFTLRACPCIRGLVSVVSGTSQRSVRDAVVRGVEILLILFRCLWS